MVRWGSQTSPSFTVSNGVRQGGIMSPICFNVFLDDMSTALNRYSGGCMVNSCKINHLFYADDSVLIAPSPHALQEMIDICEKYGKATELSFNAKKTKVMCFKPKSLSSLHVPDFYVNGRKIEHVSSHLYLGVIIEDCYYDNMDLRRQTKALYARGNTLIKRFSVCNDDVKVKLFKAYFSSFYCCQLWCSYSCVSLRKLKSSYNRIMRGMFKLEKDCSISAKCIDLNLDCFEVILRKSVYSFRSRILSTDNVLIQSICLSNYFYHCPLTKCWNNILFTF